MQHTSGSRRWEDVESQYRTEWERNNPTKSWSSVSRGYRYGWESAQDPRYHGRDWGNVESDLRSGWSDWETRSRMAGQAARDVGHEARQTTRAVGDDVGRAARNMGDEARATGRGVAHRVADAWDDLKDSVRHGWEKAKSAL